MTELFLKIVNMSITASILVGLVLILRLIFQKAPKWVNVLLWGLVAIRLVLPFGIESSFSLIPKTDWIVQESEVHFDTVAGNTPAVEVSDPGKDVIVAYTPVNPEIESQRGVNVSFMLSCIWICGMVLLLLYLAVSYFRIFLRIRTAKRFEDNIYLSSAIDSPFVFGVFRPRICLPENMDAVNMSYVVSHEQAHISRRDHWWKPIGFLLLSIHWFNPVLWLAYILLCRDIEMACDEKVVRDMGEVERADYSEALLECSVKRTIISACPLAFGEVGVKTRIKSVLNYKKPAFWMIAAAVLACVVAAVCFLTNPMDKTEISIDEHDWYFERVFITDLENNSIEEEYQRGLNPKTENAEPVNAILVPDGEPMWYQFVTGDWDTDRIGLHFIPERTDSRNARYTVELYRDTGELYQGADAVMEPMTDGDGYVLTVYFTRDGYENQLIFTTEKQPGAVQGEKKLTIDDVLTLSQKQMALTWEDFAEYTYTDAGTWNFRCIYEIDEIFWLEITGGSMHGTPMQINLCAKADYGDGAEYVDIRRRYADEYIVENFIKEHGHRISLSLDGIPEPVEEYQSDIRIQAAKSIFGAETVYASGIDKLEKISTGTVGLSEEILLYRLEYWITKGINGLVGTPPEDIRRETVYFAMFHDWTSDTWTRLGELSEAELDVLYNTAEMLEKYGNKYTAAAAEMGHVYLGDMEEDDVNTSDSEERLFGMYLSYYVDLAWDAALPIAEAENMMIDREYYNYRHDYDGSTIWIQFYGRTESGWDDRYIDITIVREHDGSHKVDPDGCVIGLNSENIKNTMQIAVENGFMDGQKNTNQSSASSENASINATLGSTEGQLIFDNAVVGSAVPEKICEYRYVPVSVTDTMRESLFRAYFGDRADEVFCKDEQKDIWQLGETMSGDFYKYETVSGGQIFTLRYSVPMLNPLDDNRKGYGETSGCTITAEEAVRLCDELLAGMTDPAQYRVDYIHYYGSNGQSPFFWICYKKILEGRTVNAYKDIFFFVDDNGVEEMKGAFYDTEVTAEYSEVLSAEQAVEALRKQLDEVNWKEIGISEVSRISLEYITEREASGWGTWGNDLGSLTILPIWRIELGKTEEERILNRNRIIGVHAVTGELIQNLTGMGNYN